MLELFFKRETSDRYKGDFIARLSNSHKEKLRSKRWKALEEILLSGFICVLIEPLWIKV